MSSIHPSVLFHFMIGTTQQCCGAGQSRYFWSEPVQRSGSSSSIDKTDEILNDILFVISHIDKKLFKKQILKIYK